jgi:glutathione S-transferase
MKLYFSPNACSLSPHIVAREAGLKFDLVKVDNATKRTSDGQDYRAINPKGYVPALELADGTVLTEGPAIVQYLADQAPASGLAAPNGSIQRYKLQEMLNFITSELHKAWSPLWNKAAHPAQIEAAKAAIDRRFKDLQSTLDTQPYLMGKDFTVADAYLFVVANWGQWTGVDLDQYPWIKAHYERVKARPAVQAAIAAESAAKRA